MNPKRWPWPVHVLAIPGLWGVGYALDDHLGDPWDAIFGLVAGAMVVILGVTLIDRYRIWRGIDRSDSEPSS